MNNIIDELSVNVEQSNIADDVYMSKIGRHLKKEDDVEVIVWIQN